ncbi:hypothetical protein BH11ACT8_BH11ACT8_04960 [soil metagenome]
MMRNVGDGAVHIAEHEEPPGDEAPEESAVARSARRRRRGLWAALVVVVLWMGAGAVLSDPTAPRPEWAFLHVSSDGTPVAYPCGPIGYVVRPEGAPDDWPAVVADAVDAVEQASGYDLVDRTTTPRPETAGPVVFIRWGDEQTDPSLAGTVVGTGGSHPVDDRNRGTQHYEQGEILLDTRGVGTYSAADRRITLMHEFGHVLGLDHVESAREIMSTGQYRATEDFGPGDLIGLARLHDTSC